MHDDYERAVYYCLQYMTEAFCKPTEGFFVQSQFTTENMWSNWQKDEEHGLWHGISTTTVALLLSDSFPSDQLLSSCLLHDFLKCNGWPQEQHDCDLINFFPHLLPETYTHANPTEHTSLLVMADVLELRRYSDWPTWYNPNIVESCLPTETLRCLHYYYDHIRPRKGHHNDVFSKIFKNLENLISERIKALAT